MIEITLNDSDFQRGLSQLLRNATHTAPMMRGMAEELHNFTKSNFASESWGGDKWKPSQAAMSEGRKTLYKWGDLHDKITTETGNDYARIGTNIKYAAIHHFGGKAGRGHKVSLPPRPYLPMKNDNELQPGAKDKLLQIAIDALSSGV